MWVAITYVMRYERPADIVKRFEKGGYDKLSVSPECPQVMEVHFLYTSWNERWETRARTHARTISRWARRVKAKAQMSVTRKTIVMMEIEYCEGDPYKHDSGRYPLARKGKGRSEKKNVCVGSRLFCISRCRGKSSDKARGREGLTRLREGEPLEADKA